MSVRSLPTSTRPIRHRRRVVRMGIARSVRSLQILAVMCQLGEEVGWLLVCRLQPLLSFCSAAKGPVCPTLLIGGEWLQVSATWGDSLAEVPLVVIRSRCYSWVAIAVFKALDGDGICIFPFPAYYMFDSSFKLRWEVINWSNNTIRNVFD